MRARAEAKNAPAEPTRARMAVGFSGELTQPSCACRGRAAERSRAKPRSIRVDFFIDGLPLGRYWRKSRFVNAENRFSVVPFSQFGIDPMFTKTIEVAETMS